MDPRPLSYGRPSRPVGAARVRGLQARPELNGSTAVVVSFDESKGRYNVEIPGGSVMALKPANLAADPAAGGGSQADVLKRLKFLRVVRCLRLVKLMRLLRASRMMARWETRISINY